jgi:hypothetical protein
MYDNISIVINCGDDERRRHHELYWTIGPVTKVHNMAKTQAKKAAATFMLMDDQKVTLSVQAADDVGNPTGPIAGTATWTVSDPTILLLTMNPDGSATVASTAKVGMANVNVSVPDPASPTNPPLTGTLAVQVTTSSATGITVVPGVPAHV